MTNAAVARTGDLPGSELPAAESSASAVSWAAILGGAAAAGGITLVLVILGSAFGFASLSPWASAGAAATTFTVVTAIWLIVVQWLSSGIGGYIAGRLRTKWTGRNRDEVFFRDTAHGLLAWAVATLAVACLISQAATSVLSTGAQVVGTAASGAAGAAAEMASNADPLAYHIDTMLRPAQQPVPAATYPGASNQAAGDRDLRGETTRILLTGLKGGDVPPADKTYLAQLVATQAGIPQADAEKRVEEVITQAKTLETKAREAADAARKTAVLAAFFTAFSMLIGAFIASAAAALGGQHRDEI